MCVSWGCGHSGVDTHLTGWTGPLNCGVLEPHTYLGEVVMAKARNQVTARSVITAIHAAQRALDRAIDLAVNSPAVDGGGVAWKALLRASDQLHDAHMELKYPGE